MKVLWSAYFIIKLIKWNNSVDFNSKIPQIPVSLYPGINFLASTLKANKFVSDGENTLPLWKQEE